MKVLRIFLAAIVINGGLNGLILLLITENPFAPALTGMWMASGYVRVFDPRTGPLDMRQALRGVMLSLAGPFAPRQPNLGR
jgi:hypothetical protein